MLSSECDFACLVHSGDRCGPRAAPGKLDLFLVILTVAVRLAPARCSELPHRVLPPAHDMAMGVDDARVFAADRDFVETYRQTQWLNRCRDDRSPDAATIAAGEEGSERQKEEEAAEETGTHASAITMSCRIKSTADPAVVTTYRRLK